MKPLYLGDKTTWRSLDYVYAHDSSVYFKGDKTYYTAEGLSIPTLGALNDSLDQSINQYSNLYLTDKKKLSDFIGLKIDVTQFPRTYITYFAAAYGWTDSISPGTECWSVTDTAHTQEEMQSTGDLPVFKIDRPYRELSNEMLFEVELLDSTYLRVSHWDGYKRSFLTLNNNLTSMYFEFEQPDQDKLTSMQVFEYSHDTSTSYISIFKKLADGYYDFKKAGGQLVVNTAKGWQYIPNSYKNTKVTSFTGDIPIYDTWVSYTTGLAQNNVIINKARSHTNIVHNFLLNTEYIYNDVTENQINILPLKNHITNHHQLSRTNPFRNSSTHNTTPTQTEPETLFRDYTSLSTGCNQIKGLENIHVNYRDYTELLTFKSDKVTYFHMPPDLYPYRKLNIQDSGLRESGSIAGDQPTRSDKVFKKRANYKDYSEWGNSVDEQSGTYLCTWLYWTGEESVDPIWLDRYYNPGEFTIYEAMSARPLVEVITTFDNMILDNPPANHVVFDKVSDLCFEPGVLYCYHRIGQSDVSNAIDRLTPNLIQYNFSTYKTSAGNSLPVTYEQNIPVYDFTGKEIATTAVLDGLLDTNSFNITFSMYSEDWSLPFGSQLIGNYNNTGFGIFNQQKYTPIYVQQGASTKLLNTDCDQVLNLPMSSIHAFKAPISDNIFIYNYDNNGSIYEYDLNGVLRERSIVPVYDNSVYPPVPRKPYIVTHDLDYIYLVYSNNKYAAIDIQTEEIKLHESAIQSVHETRISPTVNYVSAVVVSGKLYGLDVPEEVVQVCNDTVYWMENNAVYTYNTTTAVYNTALQSTDYVLREYVVDASGSIYIIYRETTSTTTGIYDYHIIKLASNNNILFNSPIASINPVLSAMDLETKILMTYSLENELGNDVEHLYLLTDHLSTYSEYSPSLDEVVDIEQEVTMYTKINHDGSLNSNLVLSSLLSTFTGIDNQLNDIVDRHRSNPIGNTLSFNLRLRNTYNRDRYEDIQLTAPVTDLDRGWHQMTYDYNSTTGKILLFIDSIQVGSYDFDPGKYRFTDMSIQQYLIGTSSAYNGVSFNEFLQQPGNYMSKNFKLKDVHIYNKSVNYYDIKFFYRKIKNIRDIKWTIPCNSRNYIDEIQHVFNHSRGVVKTNNFNINILSDKITNPNLRSDLSTDIKLRLHDQSPMRATVDNITWHNTT